MKAVILVAPSFAPGSYPPAIRARFFATHLPKFGWRPIVVTVRPEFLEEPLDPEFLSLLPEMEVIRTAALPQRLTRLFHFGDLGLRSFLFHLHKTWSLCRQRADAILIPGPPWYSFCLGPILHREFNVPYVLDYIDPWVDSLGAEAAPFSKAWIAHRLALLLERSVIREAAAIVAVSDGTNNTIRTRYPDVPTERFSAIPYGFEANDFAAVGALDQPSKYLAPFKDNLNICYVGAMLPKAYGTLRALFRGIKYLKGSNSGVGQLRFHFFGTTYAIGAGTRPLVLPVAREEGVEDLVNEHPERIPYLEALRLMLSSDLLLALGSSEPHYTASKIFPNLLARRPLLALYHEASSVCTVLRRSRSGCLITFNEQRPAEACVKEIAHALRDFIEGRTFGSDPEGIDTVAREFSACEMTRALAAVLDRVAGSSCTANESLAVGSP